MTFDLLVIVVGLVAVLLFFAAVRDFRRRRVLGGWLSGMTGLALLLLAGGAVLAAVNLRTYERLTHEQPAGELQFSRIGYHQFNGVFTLANGERADFALRGDEWQVDARLLKWTALANLLGFDAAYRLDRISGRYTNIEDEQHLPRTVYPLTQPDRVDIWQLLHDHQGWIPWVDAQYGTATFLPMADGALYAINVSQSGLIARPLNEAARTAVGGWH